MRTLLSVASVAFLLIWTGCSGPSAPRGAETPQTVLEPVLVLPTSKLEVAIRADNNKFVCADLGRNGILVADRPGKGEWETFTLAPVEGGRFALIASNGKYVSADQGKDNSLIADRDEVGEWELFELIPVGEGGYNLRSSNGRFVSAALGGSGDEYAILRADRESADAWERFTLLRQGSPAGQP